MPSKKEKQQQALLALKNQAAALANSTNTNVDTTLINSQSTGTTNVKKTLSNNPNSSIVLDSVALAQNQKTELDELNNRFSNYVLGLRKKTQENNELEKQVTIEKQKQKDFSKTDRDELENKLIELRSNVDEQIISIENLNRQRNRWLKEINLFKDKVRTEEDPSLVNRRQQLENEHQESELQLRELIRRVTEAERSRTAQKNEVEQLEKTSENLEIELNDLVLGNVKLECDLKTIEERIFLRKTVYETEKADLGNEQLKQKQFYNNELDKAINDIKEDFSNLLKTNKNLLEKSYGERIEQIKAQTLISTSSKDENSSIVPRVSIESLKSELKQIEKTREDVENEYRPLLENFFKKQQEKSLIDEERFRLDAEHNRLLNEVNQLTEAIEIGRQFWFSVRFELETYRRLLDFQGEKTILTNHSDLSNGKDEHIHNEQKPTVQIIKKNELQRSISKNGKFDIDQVQAGFISINNAATNCVDQSLKGWTLVRTVNENEPTTFRFPENYVLRARTRVRVYSNKIENSGTSHASQGRLIAAMVPAWASLTIGENIKIELFDDNDNSRAQYTETWQ